jgi:hypothetical protein
MHILYILSFVIPICLQVAILVLLSKRRLQQRFHWFLIYLLYEIFEEISRLAVSGNKHAYYVVYWSTSALAVLFTFMAIRESFLNVFWAFTRLRWFRRLFWASICVAAAYSIAKALVQPPSNESLFVALTLHAEQTFEYLICATGVFYFGAAKWFDIKEYQWEYKVVLGFFLIAAVSNLGFVVRSIFGTRFAKFADWLPALAYIFGAVIWLLNFSRTERKQPKPPVDLTPEQIMAEISRYQQFIKNARSILRRKNK